MLLSLFALIEWVFLTLATGVAVCFLLWILLNILELFDYILGEFVNFWRSKGKTW